MPAGFGSARVRQIESAQSASVHALLGLDEGAAGEHLVKVPFSVGDFLDRAYLYELAATGLDSINISIHTAPGQSYSDGEMISRILQMGRKLGIDPVLKEPALIYAKP